jgi:hypothetical protein
MDIQLKEYRDNMQKKYNLHKRTKNVVKKNTKLKKISTIFYDSDEDSDEDSSDDSVISFDSDVYHVGYILVSDDEDSCDEKVKTTQNKHSKKRKKSIPLAVKKIVWNKYIGENIGKHKCYCCRLTDITQISFHCGHVISESNGGKINIENLRPICQNCNSSMGTKNMDEFINEYNIHKII